MDIKTWQLHYLFIYCITCKADCQIPALDKPIWFSTLSELTVVRYVKVNSVAICWHILSQILDSYHSSAQSRNFIFTSTNRPPFSIMHAKTSEEHSNASLRKSIYTTAKAKKEKMHQDQSVSKPSIISEKIKIRLKTAHFLHRLTTFFLCIRTYPHHSVHSYAILYLPFRKRKAKDILLCHRHHLYCFFQAWQLK